MLLRSQSRFPDPAGIPKPHGPGLCVFKEFYELPTLGINDRAAARAHAQGRTSSRQPQGAAYPGVLAGGLAPQPCTPRLRPGPVRASACHLQRAPSPKRSRDYDEQMAPRDSPALPSAQLPGPGTRPSIAAGVCHPEEGLCCGTLSLATRRTRQCGRPLGPTVPGPFLNPVSRQPTETNRRV